MQVYSRYLVPETGVVEPLQEPLAHDHGAGEEGPVCQQKVLNVGWVHHRVLLHQVHGETLRRALWFKMIVLLVENSHLSNVFGLQKSVRAADRYLIGLFE